MAITTVVEIEGTDVVLGAGRSDGLGPGAQVVLLREGDPIVHPLTGEVLGIPQEPVGMVHVVEAQDRQARGVMKKTYSAPMVDDLAEYEKAAVLPAQMEPEDKNAEVELVIERVQKLEKKVKGYQKSSKALSAYPTFAQEVWDEIMVVKSYLVALDERLVELEEQQGEDRIRLGSVINGEYRKQDMEIITIGYKPGTSVVLEVAGKTLVLSVEQDSLHLEEVVEEEDMGMDMEEDQQEAEGGGEWYRGIVESNYTMYGIIGLFVLIALYIVSTMLKRRRRDETGEIDEFDEEDYLEDEEE